MFIDGYISNWEAQNAKWKRWYPRDDFFLQPRMFHDGALLPRWHAQPNVILAPRRRLFCFSCGVSIMMLTSARIPTSVPGT